MYNYFNAGNKFFFKFYSRIVIIILDNFKELLKTRKKIIPKYLFSL